MTENLMLRSLARSHGFEPLRVEGTLPAELRGTLYRAGPGIFERFGRTLSHAFEADGAVTGVRFGEGRAWGACRVVESAGYRQEEARGRYLYNSAASWLDRVRAVRAGVAKTTGNTSMFAWQDRLFALMEGGLAQEMDPKELETLEAVDFGVVSKAFSAHPHRVASLGTTFNFGLRYERKMFIDLYALPDEGAVRKIGTVEAPWMSLVHDFVATERHLVLCICPVRLVLWRALLGLADFTKLFRWAPELGTRLIVVPLDDPGRPRSFEVDPFWVWHFVNAFEDGGDIAIDVCRYEDFSSLGEIGSETSESLPTLMRLQLDSTTGRTRWSKLCDTAVDFPQVHPRVQGARHRSTFAQTRGSQGDAISLIDEGGSLSSWSAPSDQVIGEPVLVPRSDVESDAWVLDLVLDRSTGTSHVAVLDGQRLPEGPLARVHFDHAIPITFHGTFVGSESGAQ
jgi:all-trans-8'-apo-beta-carotenal 15,15'-oxygenase